MNDPTYIAELQKRLGAPSSETLEGLRLLKALLKLEPDQRSESSKWSSVMRLVLRRSYLS